MFSGPWGIRFYCSAKKKKSYANLVKIKAATIKCWRVHTFLALLISNGWLVHGNCGLRQCFNDSTAFTSKGLVWGEVHSHPVPHALRRTHTLWFVLRYHPTTIPCCDYYKGPLHTRPCVSVFTVDANIRLPFYFSAQGRFFFFSTPNLDTANKGINQSQWFCGTDVTSLYNDKGSQAHSGFLSTKHCLTNETRIIIKTTNIKIVCGKVSLISRASWVVTALSFQISWSRL